MSYTKTNWKTGDVVTSEKLNKMEDGIAEAGGEVLVVNETIDQNDTYILDKTWQEIYDAMASNKLVLIKPVDISKLNGGYSCALNPVQLAGYKPGESAPYMIGVTSHLTPTYSASTPNDYPSPLPSPSTGGSSSVNQNTESQPMNRKKEDEKDDILQDDEEA